VCSSDLTTKFYLGGIYGYRGMAYNSSGSILKAVRDGRKGYLYLEDAVRDRPDLYDAQMGFGLFRYLIAKVPRSMSYILSLLGFSGDLEGGLHSLRLAAEKGIYTRTEAKLFLSQFLFSEGRRDTAFQYLEELCTDYPENTLFFVLYASWQNRLGDVDKAYPAIRKAMELNNRKKIKYGEEFVFSTLGSINFTKNQFDSSMAYYRKYMATTKNDERTPNITFLRAGEACEISGDRNTAVGYYRRMKEPRERAWDSYNYRRGQELISRPLTPGEILVIRAANESTLKHPERSFRLYREAFAEAGTDVDLQLRALYGIQQIQYDSTHLADAVETSLRLLALKPVKELWIIPHAWFRLGLIYEKQGKFEDARKTLEHVREFDGYDFESQLEEQVKEELSKLDVAAPKAG
jgi:tetratricopeptide (TPR) repeat protein